MDSSMSQEDAEAIRQTIEGFDEKGDALPPDTSSMRIDPGDRVVVGGKAGSFTTTVHKITKRHIVLVRPRVKRDPAKKEGQG